jgi:hypothetical protein
MVTVKNFFIDNRLTAGNYFWRQYASTLSGICGGVERSFVMPLEINHPVGCKKTGDIKRKAGFYPVAMARM